MASREGGREACIRDQHDVMRTVEAHPQDRWPLGSHVSVFAPHSTADRIEIAKRFVQENQYQTHMVVDAIDNTFMKTFWCHPERFFVVNDGTLLLKAQPEGACYYLQEMASFLNTLVSKPVDPAVIAARDE
jgi:hypothetical protein